MVTTALFDRTSVRKFVSEKSQTRRTWRNRKRAAHYSSGKFNSFAF